MAAWSPTSEGEGLLAEDNLLSMALLLLFVALPDTGPRVQTATRRIILHESVLIHAPPDTTKHAAFSLPLQKTRTQRRVQSRAIGLADFAS
jgi:hypothetical protein